MCKIKEMTRQQNSIQKAMDIMMYLQEYTQKFVSRHATKKVVGHEHTIIRISLSTARFMDYDDQA